MPTGKWWWLCLAAAVAIAAGFGFGRGIGRVGMGSVSGPGLAIQQPVQDFGPVAYEVNVAPAWELANVGDAPLEIRDIFVEVVAGC